MRRNSRVVRLNENDVRRLVRSMIREQLSGPKLGSDWELPEIEPAEPLSLDKESSYGEDSDAWEGPETEEDYEDMQADRISWEDKHDRHFYGRHDESRATRSNRAGQRRW